MNRFELEQFIRQRGREIYSFCRYLTRNREEADDLYQDAFVKALELSGLPEDHEAAKNVLLSQTVRLWKDRRRKAAWRRRIAEEKFYPQAVREQNGAEQFTPETFALEREKVEAVRSCVNRLPEKMRLVVLLYYMENRTVAEIAEMLSIPPGTVKSRLFQARKLLAERLSDREEVAR